jgi:hypothetical protein
MTKVEGASSILIRPPCTNLLKPIQPGLRMRKGRGIQAERIMERTLSGLFKKTSPFVDSCRINPMPVSEHCVYYSQRWRCAFGGGTAMPHKHVETKILYYGGNTG